LHLSTVTNTVQRSSDISICDFGAVSKGSYLLTYSASV